MLDEQLGGLKEHYLDDFAARFHAEGFAVLLYDNRSWGASDGSPRQESDPWRQVEDIHAAVSYCLTLPGIVPDRVVIWGSQLLGGNCLIAAAVDFRIKAVISQVPFISGEGFLRNFPKELVDAMYTNRVHGVAPEYTRLYAQTTEEAIANGHNLILGTKESAAYWQETSKKELAPGVEWKNQVTLQSLYHLVKHEPGAFIHRIAPRPLLMAIASNDSILPAAEARAAFEKAGEGKEVVEFECGHFDAYRGEMFKKNVKTQVEFLQRHML